MSTINSPQYPFDPTGQAPTNRVTGELQPLTGGGDQNFIFLVPAAAPFFGESLSLNFKSLQGDIRPLVLGVDFYLSHYFIGASRSTGKPVYGSITMLNNELRGTVIFNPYQTIGGEWTVDPNTITEILADQAYNPRTTSWDQVAGYPNLFPPTAHEWNLKDMVGMSSVLAALNRVTDAILTRASSDMAEHINAQGNVHNLTAGDLGAVTNDQMQLAIEEALNDLDRTTDDFLEGKNNKFFTEARVLATKLSDFAAIAPSNISEADNILNAFMKLQALYSALSTTVDKKASMFRPQFSGLGSQNLVKIPMNGTIAIDISLAEAFQLTISANGAIGFDIRSVGDMANKVVEFSITTINDNSTNAYAIAWPSNVKWVDGVAPGRTTASGAKDEWYFWSEDNMATWTGSLSNKNTR
jgi:hypothetical protein